MGSFGRYRLIRKVATGGMAEIWKARAEGPAGFQKTLAIKKVLPDLAEDPNFVEMFVSEAKIVAALVHPNIVQVFDFGQVESDYFIAMEYVAGTNLARVLAKKAQQKSKLPPEIPIYLVMETCKALGYAHAKSGAGGKKLEIVHRDVSPHNLLVSFDGELKVTDFGIAKVASAVASKTMAGMLRGKIAYMSPEQAQMKALDKRSDLFSLGLVLYELLSAKRAFMGAAEQILTSLNDWKGPTDEMLSHVPENLRPILKRALQGDPDARYQDARELEADLEVELGTGRAEVRAALEKIVRALFPDEERAEQADDDEPSVELAAAPITARMENPPGAPPDPADKTLVGSGSAAVVENTTTTPVPHRPPADPAGTQTLATDVPSPVKVEPPAPAVEPLPPVVAPSTPAVDPPPLAAELPPPAIAPPPQPLLEPLPAASIAPWERPVEDRPSSARLRKPMMPTPPTRPERRSMPIVLGVLLLAGLGAGAFAVHRQQQATPDGAIAEPAEPTACDRAMAARIAVLGDRVAALDRRKAERRGAPKESFPVVTVANVEEIKPLLARARQMETATVANGRPSGSMLRAEIELTGEVFALPDVVAGLHAQPFPLVLERAEVTIDDFETRHGTVKLTVAAFHHDALAVDEAAAADPALAAALGEAPPSECAGSAVNEPLSTRLASSRAAIAARADEDQDLTEWERKNAAFAAKRRAVDALLRKKIENQTLCATEIPKLLDRVKADVTGHAILRIDERGVPHWSDK